MAIPWVSLLSLAKLKRTILIATLLLFSWPSIVTPMSLVAGLVKIIQVDSFFFLDFFMILIIIILIFSFRIKLFALVLSFFRSSFCFVISRAG
jgi:hypothetical protein